MIKIIVLLLVSIQQLHAEPVTTTHFMNITQNQEACVFNYVKQNRPRKHKTDISMPLIGYSHTLDLNTFKDEYPKNTGYSPEIFSNYFNPERLKVYLYTGYNYYKSPRSPLDSLAHEFVHYFQYMESDQDPDLQKNDFNDDLETEAVRVQSAFRDLKICSE
jgi:hypothetical protein